MSGAKVCPQCQASIAPLRWRKSALVSGYDYRCRCGKYQSSVVKDGVKRIIDIRTTLTMDDEVAFLHGHVPGPAVTN